MKQPKSWVGIGLLALFVLAVYWAQRPSLKVGDPAPKLQVMKWVKGEPVPEFERGRVYIVEFWATWCGPCMQTMPHLNELAQKYRESVQVVAVSVLENDGQAESLVQSFADKHGGRMIVAMDDPSTGPTYATWMKAAGRNSIPTSFLIDRDGKIAWIGHPLKLEKHLERAVSAQAGNT